MVCYLPGAHCPNWIPLNRRNWFRFRPVLTGRLWLFLAEPLPARDCRIYVYDVALRLGIETCVLLQYSHALDVASGLRAG